MSDPVRCRFDEVSASGPSAIELTGLEGVLEATRLSEVTEVLVEAEAAAYRGWTAAGFVAYDAAPAFDPALVVPTGDTAAVGVALPLAWFGLFSGSRAVDPLSRVATAAPRRPPGSDASHGPGWIAEITGEEHAEAVGGIRAAIADGDTYLTNLTTRFRRRWDPSDDPFALYRRLVSGHASGLHAYLETPAWVVASGSPELFFDLRSERLTVRPMKGTASRGRWVEEDHRVAEGLRTSPKERAENLMVVDLVRNDLGRIAVPGTVEVPEFCRTERHPTVWQLTSTVTATPRPGTGLTDIFGALFPCASVTGAPKVSTMRLIAELEPSPRGVYCGAVGLLRPPGAVAPGPAGLEARFAVAIRTAVVDQRLGTAEYGSGGGITWDSGAAAEWEETLVKTLVLGAETPSEPSPALLETMRFDPSDPAAPTGGVRNLDRHLHRLTDSCEYLGYPCPPDLLETVLAATAGPGPARLRLLVDGGGRVEVQLHPLDATPTDRRLRLCVDHHPVDPSDPGVFHKTTDRRRYDERAARHPDADDVVMVNELGEVTETTRANLAVRIGGRWCTPPLGCGLLPGVERGRLLDEGALTERVITLDDLHRAEAVATVSSLRGWRRAAVRPACTCGGADSGRRG